MWPPRPDGAVLAATSCRLGACRPSRRVGVALFLVLGVLALLSCLFLFLSQHSRQYRGAVHDTLTDEVAFQACRAYANTFWLFLQEVIQKRTGCDKLYPASGLGGLYPFDRNRLESMVLVPADLTAGGSVDQAFADLTAAMPEISNPVVQAGFQVLGVSEASPGALPDAVTGQLVLRVSVEHRRRTHTFEFPREFRLVRCLPPVVSRFTLFVRDGRPTHRFNTIRKAFQDERGSGGVLTLFHTPAAFSASKPEIWKESGWVFLGGAAGAMLHLDGSHPCRRESDAFLFWPGLFAGNLGQDLPHACSPPLGATSLRVRYSPLGAMTDWTDQAGLQRGLGGKTIPILDRSACLRLYGNRDHPTPTRVFGRVWADYVLFATLILDQDGDGLPDSITSPHGVEERAVFPLPRLTAPDQFQPPAAPRLVSAGGFDLLLDGQGITGVPAALTDIFPSYSGGAGNDYLTCMTKLASDFQESSGMRSFNSLYDQIFANAAGTGANRPFPPAPHLLPDGSYPDPGDNLDLPLDRNAGGDSQFRGSLQTFDPGRFFANPELFATWYDDQAEFLREGPLRTQSGVSVISQPVVARIGGPFTFPRPLRVNAPTMIVAEGDLTVGEVRPSSAGAKLVLVSLTGKITVTGRLDGVSLVAPNGTVEWASPLDLKGTLCARTLAPSTLERGGNITYDPGLDPTDPAAAGKTAVLLLGPNIAHSVKDPS